MKSVFTYLSFFFFFLGVLLQGLMVSSFGFRSREDWFFAGAIYVCSTIVLIPTIYWLGFIVNFLCVLWCLFIWFLYRLPFDKMNDSIASFLDKRKVNFIPSSISIENDPTQIFILLPLFYKIVILFLYLLALGIVFVIGISPLFL